MNTLRDINIHLENKKESRHFFIFIFIMYTLVYVTKSCFSSSMASIVDEGLFTKSQVGFITSAFYIVYAPLQIVGGIAADKYSPERLIRIGLIGGGIANLVIFFNQNYYIMLTAWILNAASQFALWPATFKIVSSQLVRSDKSNNVFLISLCASFGLMLAFLVSALIPKWQYTFLFSSVLLFVLSVVLRAFCKHLDSFMKKDYDTNENKDIAVKIPLSKIFISSGLILVLTASFINIIVDYCIKTLTPTMLMESYSTVSDSIGNLLNVLIIIFGIAGTFLVKFVLYNKVFKNEVMGMLIITLLALPFAVVRVFTGSISLWWILVASCIVSVSTTAAMLFHKYYNLAFDKYGLNGTVAGILNAVASFGIVVQSYALPLISEKFDWKTVSVTVSLLIVIALVLMAFAVIPYGKFKNK